MLVVALPAMLVTLMTIAGCNPFRRHSYANEVCKEPEGYAQSKEAAALTIPPGLEPPDPRNARRFPAPPAPGPPVRTRGQGCLDEPPAYTLPPKPKEP